MKIRELFTRIRYIGKAEGDRRIYSVFESAAGYLVLTPNSDRSFTVNIVEAGAPQVVTRKFKGRQLTAKKLRESGLRPDLFARPFSALNALYAMVGLGSARKLKRREGKAMVFKIG